MLKVSSMIFGTFYGFIEFEQSDHNWSTITVRSIMGQYCMGIFCIARQWPSFQSHSHNSPALRRPIKAYCLQEWVCAIWSRSFRQRKDVARYRRKYTQAATYHSQWPRKRSRQLLICRALFLNLRSRSLLYRFNAGSNWRIWLPSLHREYNHFWRWSAFRLGLWQYQCSGNAIPYQRSPDPSQPRTIVPRYGFEQNSPFLR